MGSHWLDTQHWVCRRCIGKDVEEFTIGLVGTTACEVCGWTLKQPEIKCVNAAVYHYARGRNDMRYAILASIDKTYNQAVKERNAAEEEDDDSNETSWCCGYCAGFVESNDIAERL